MHSEPHADEPTPSLSSDIDAFLKLTVRDRSGHGTLGPACRHWGKLHWMVQLVALPGQLHKSFGSRHSMFNGREIEECRTSTWKQR